MAFFHLAQLKMKRVCVNDDAVAVFNNDHFWDDETDDQKAVSLGIITTIAGKESTVLAIQRQRSRIFYLVPVDPPVRYIDPHGQVQMIDRTFWPADYMTVIDHGFMDAT